MTMEFPEIYCFSKVSSTSTSVEVTTIIVISYTFDYVIINEEKLNTWINKNAMFEFEWHFWELVNCRNLSIVSATKNIQILCSELIISTHGIYRVKCRLRKLFTITLLIFFYMSFRWFILFEYKFMYSKIEQRYLLF